MHGHHGFFPPKAGAALCTFYFIQVTYTLTKHTGFHRKYI